MNRGRKLYHTSMLPLFRWFLLILLILFFHDFYLETFQDPRFIADGKSGFFDVWRFHWRYPFELISFSVLIFPPFIYYSWLRGTAFYENGILYNKGLPFYNSYVLYENIKTYKILHPQHILILFAENGENYFISNGSLDRVLAIVDQHNVKGELYHQEFQKLIKHLKRFLITIVVFTAVVYLLKKNAWLKLF